MRIFVLRLAAAVAVLLPSSVLAQGEPIEQLHRQFELMDDALDDQGLYPAGEILTGYLQQGGTETVDIDFNSTGFFQIVGVCDNDCSDVDMVLFDPDGNHVVEDLLVDDVPVLEFQAAAGVYRLEIRMVACSVEPCFWGAQRYGDNLSTRGGSRVERGELEPGDETLPEGEYADVYTLDGRAGDMVVLDLTSSDFDTYVVLVDPSGDQEENDDYEGDARRSMLGVELDSDGEHTVVVTSYAADETGSYRLEISQTAQGETALASGSESMSGALAAGDRTLDSDEYLDVFPFQGRPGDVVRLDLRSEDFDTYLMILGPGDFRRENDDGEDGIGHSSLEVVLPEFGEYSVLVTSFEPGEMGAYTLTRDIGESGEVTVAQRDVESLRIGGSGQGTLELGDGELDGGEWRDLWVFDGEAGQNLVAEVSSSDFDTYIMLVSPDGQVIDENDDADGDTGLSRLEISLRDSGRYRLVATTLSPGESGQYVVSLRDTGGTRTVTPTRPAGGGEGGKVYGVFVGISDYGGRANDLPFTADDARRAADAMVEGAGMEVADAIVLTDADATVENMRDAFEQMGRVVRPEDTFVFFYSGHGARIPMSGGDSRADPDGLDETIELYDATIRDHEFSNLLGMIDSELSMVILDSCFSGGFSKDVISEPGRMGFFSSEEDVTSQVASKFRAGGYLAQFIFDGVGERLADLDGDNTINAIELSQYLHDRYRFDVKSADPDEYVRTGGPQSGFQHLVVDRGSIGPYDVVFR